MSEDFQWPDITGNFNPTHNPFPENLMPENPFSLADMMSKSAAQDLRALHGKQAASTQVPPPLPKVPCLTAYSFGNYYRPCHLDKGHTGQHSHRSYGSSPNVITYSQNNDEPIVVEYDSTGRPLPSNTFRKGFEHCSETQRYEHNSIVVTVKGHGTKVIWPGKEGLGFIYYVDEGFTIVRIYEIKNKTCLTTRWYNGTLSKDEIRALLFDGTFPSSKAREEARKGGKPYKSTFRHLIMSKADFDKKFRPNMFRTVTYSHKNDDTALKSIGEMLRSAPSAETEAGNAPAAINGALKKIRDIRNSFLSVKNEVKAEFPVVEVYAIWHNYDFDARLIYSNYDASEPLYYHYNVFNTAQEMDECPT